MTDAIYGFITTQTTNTTQNRHFKYNTKLSLNKTRFFSISCQFQCNYNDLAKNCEHAPKKCWVILH